MRTLVSIAFLCVASTAVAQDIDPMNNNSITMPPAANQDQISSFSVADYGVPEITPERAQFLATKAQRGTTVNVPVSVVAQLCGDFDGCTFRLGMHNWDNSGRVASRESLLYFNSVNGIWRTSAGDRADTDFDGVTTHVMQAWACHFTDGRYSNWTNLGDPEHNFGLLSWSQYNADCFLTLID